MKKLTIVFLTLCSLAAGSIRAEEVNGILGWSGTTMYAFAVNGVVAKVNVSSGQSVKQGETLAQLDMLPFTLALTKSRARIANIKPQLDAAKRDYEQAKELFEQTVLSAVELQQAEELFKQFSAELKMANADVKLANWQQAKARLVAASDGRIVESGFLPGMVISDENKSHVYQILAKPGVMLVTISVEPEQLSQMSHGKKMSIEVATEKYSGHVHSITANEDLSSYRVAIIFQHEKNKSYVAGQKAKVIF